MIGCRKGGGIDMRKENGRLKPADEKETAELKGKPFKCKRCGVIEYYTNVTFGSIQYCQECGAPMREDFIMK